MNENKPREKKHPNKNEDDNEIIAVSSVKGTLQQIKNVEDPEHMSHVQQFFEEFHPLRSPKMTHTQCFSSCIFKQHNFVYLFNVSTQQNDRIWNTIRIGKM